MPDTTLTPQGDRLKAARKAASLTQAELAAKLGTTRSYLCQIEAGARVPTARWMMAAAVALGLDPAEFAPSDAP